MIPARKSRFFNAWFAGHARSRIHGAFGAVRVRGLGLARAAAARGPLLIVSNHTSWWDPLVVLHLSEHVLRTDGYALMDAKNLRRLPFFALVGGFGIELDRPSDGAAGMKYAARLLDQPGRLVWVFPQGRERPVSARPLDFRAGSAEIARIARRAEAMPAALRYEFGAEERPHLYVSFGEPLAPTRDVVQGRQEQERAVTRELDRVERALGGDAEATAEFETIYRTRVSLLGALAERLLARMTRRRAGLTPLPSGGARNDPP